MKKYIIIFLACLLIFVATLFARRYYLSYFFKRNLISEVINVPLQFQSDTADVDLLQLKGKFIVLYFENPTDKNYLKDNKKLQKICNSRIKNDDRVKMFAINCNPDNVSHSIETEYLQTNNFHIPTLSLDRNILLEQLKINSLPTVLIISPEWEIKFRGSSLDAAYKCILALTYAVT